MQLPDVDFQNLFNERLRERSFSLKKLSEASGVAVKHLENLRAGRFDRLPPAPYLRGYLVRLGNILDFDGEAWWESLQKDGFTKGSGPHDQLPKNRFAVEPLNRRLWLVVVIVFLGAYLGFRFPKIFGTPTIVLSLSNNETPTIFSPEFVLRGEIKGGDRLTVNGEPVPLNADGSWTKTVILQQGLNTIRIVGYKFLGREKELIRQIIYEEATTTAPFF